jgi:type VI secretion system secreted protein Hcp
MAVLDAFLGIDGIRGGSTDARYKDWIDVVAYNHGMAQPPSSTGTGGSAGRTSFQDFVITKALDRATPRLAVVCASGQHVRSATLVLRRAGKSEQPFMEYKLTDVLITSIRPRWGSVDPTIPLEEVSFSYGKIEWKYVDLNGQIVQGGWDLRANRPAASSVGMTDPSEIMPPAGEEESTSGPAEPSAPTGAAESPPSESATSPEELIPKDHLDL